MQESTLHAKIYLEDTDAQGIVYHANYLKYFERARSEIMVGLGFDLRDQLRGKRRFVVHEMNLKFKEPALLGDQIEVRSEFRRTSGYRLTFDQRALRSSDEQLLVSAKVDVVCVDGEGNLSSLPEQIPS
jgi:tol-pal system-associated acyl-CoA thioesterase